MFKLWKYAPKFVWWLVALVIVLIIGRVYCDITLPDYVNYLTKMAEGIDINTGSAHTYSIKQIWAEGGIMSIYIVADVFCMIMIFYLSSKIGSNISYGLRRQIYGKITNFSSNEINNFSVPHLITISTNDVVQVQNTSMTFLRLALAAPITMIWGISKTVIGNSVYSNSTGIVIGLCLGAALVLIITIISLVMPKMRKQQLFADKINNDVRNQIQGVRVIRAFGAEKFEYEKFDNINKDVSKLNIFTNKIFNLAFPLIFGVTDIMTILIYLCGGLKDEEIGAIMASANLGTVVFMAFMMCIMLFFILPRGIISAKRINNVLNTNNTVIFKDNPIKINDFTSLEFKNVSFKYGKEAKNVVENLDFKIDAGSSIGIIGKTGCGKTTLVNLLLRYYDVTEGEILINGINIKDLSKQNISEIFSIIPQKASLFNVSIKDNIGFGLKNKDIKKIKWAAKIACADFINELPQKYSTYVSQGGNNLSGGQKQRIAIARAVAKKSPFLIFDDSLSALDYKTDSKVRNNIDAELKNTTKLVVSSRISTIKKSDVIIVLKEGKIVGCGKHEDLFKTCDEYKDIALSQLSRKEVDL